MKKSFSLFELIIVILVISIIASYAIPKYNNYLEKTNMTKLKVQLSIINAKLADKRTENTLLGNENSIVSLDEALIEQTSQSLFTYILDENIISTNSVEKKSGFWSKISNDSYEFYISSDKIVKFKIQDEYFICKSEYEICKDFE